MSSSVSSIYGCEYNLLSSASDRYCTDLLNPLIPFCDFTDPSCCTSAYKFATEQASCIASHEPCVNLASWTSEANDGLSSCVSQVKSAQTAITTATGGVTASNTGSAAATAATGASVTPKPTVGSTATSTSVQAASSTVTKTSGGNTQMVVSKNGVLVCGVAITLLLLQVMV